MPFIILFKDNPDADPDIRKTHMEAHLSFLEQHRDQISAAGPLMDTDGRGQGGIWVLDAPDAASVETLIREDPFWETGLRASYDILQWKQVFADGQRQI